MQFVTLNNFKTIFIININNFNYLKYLLQISLKSHTKNPNNLYC